MGGKKHDKGHLFKFKICFCTRTKEKWKVQVTVTSRCLKLHNTFDSQYQTETETETETEYENRANLSTRGVLKMLSNREEIRFVWDKNESTMQGFEECS